jgi:hypothetical protein
MGKRGTSVFESGGGIVLLISVPHLELFQELNTTLLDLHDPGRIRHVEKSSFEWRHLRVGTKTRSEMQNPRHECMNQGVVPVSPL